MLRVLILLAVTVSCSPGQTITVTIQGDVEELWGTLNNPYGSPKLLDPSVQIGTPFTFVQTIDATAQPGLYNGGGYGSDTSFVSSLKVGDYDFEANGSETYVGPYEIRLFPNLIEGQEDGFQYPGFQADLFSNSTVSNPSLSTLLQDSISDFNGGGVQLYDYGMGIQMLFLGNLTSYSAVETPEPSTWALLLCGLGFVGVMARRVRV